MQQRSKCTCHKNGRSGPAHLDPGSQPLAKIEALALSPDVHAPVQQQGIPHLVRAALRQAHLHRLAVFIVGAQQRRQGPAGIDHQQITRAKEFPQCIEPGMNQGPVQARQHQQAHLVPAHAAQFGRLVGFQLGR